MRTLLISTGSRGDVEPFVALARGLQDAGHTPTLAAPARFRDMATLHGVDFVGLDDSLFDLQEELAHQGTFASLRGASKARPALRRFLSDVADLSEYGTDAVVYHPKTLAAPMVADKQGVPAIAAQLIPLYQPTTAFPSPLVTRGLPRWLNRPSWRIVTAVEAPWRSALRQIQRDRLGLSGPLISLTERIGASSTLNAWSPHLLPAPADWAGDAEPLGFWRLPPRQWHPPEPLVDFLESGEAPVYVGFGSMYSRDPAKVGRAVRDGLRQARCRGVVTTGSGAIELESSDDIYVLDQAPHDWLLPQVSVAVHHGGIGTVAAAMAAGVPQVIRPFLGDQPFWARRVRELRAGVLLRASTAAGITAAIAGATRLAPQCRTLAHEVRREEGIAAAIRRIEHASLTVEG